MRDGPDRRVGRRAQDRLDRRARVARRDHARLRGERRRRPPAVRVDRALRDRRRADDLACSRRPAAPDGDAAASASAWRGGSREAFGLRQRLVSQARLERSGLARVGTGVSVEHSTRSRANPGGARVLEHGRGAARSASASRRGSRCQRPAAPKYRELKPDDRRRGAAHRLPGGRLPEHRRVLAARHGHVHDPRRHLHAPLRLLQRQDRQADVQRPARAAARGASR